MTKQQKILVAEQDSDLRTLIKQELENKNFQVLTAENGMQAFELFQTKNPDLLITGFNMPHANGIELIQNIQKNQSDFPIMLVLSDYNQIDESDAYELGVKGIYNKPIPFSKLIYKVERLLAPETKIWDRVHQRYQLELQTEVTLPDKSIISSQTEDVGQGGFFFKLDKELEKVEIDAFIKFTIHLESEKDIAITGTGRVRWINLNKNQYLSQGIGIEFEYLEHQSSIHLLKLIQDLS